ncbi:hypothetical protein Ahy_A03g010333 [Arachis hypogaea]|uniref:Uncharacterized protein n=1 Tax=Arachis hypogaea TaxID=3818 RepID=A0A445DLX3_ARAHY|nr:hypothetical protein Ahy_A03g010333 [Arachis hypogaea]
MAKSLRSKREKRLRAIRREIVEPLYEKKEAAKQAALEAALAAPKLEVRQPSNSAMDASTASATITNMDVEMADGAQSTASLKPVGGVGKKFKKKLKIAKSKRRGKGKKKRTNYFKSLSTRQFVQGQSILPCVMPISPKRPDLMSCHPTDLRPKCIKTQKEDEPFQILFLLLVPDR